MKHEEFRTLITSDGDLQRRFVSDPRAVLAECGVGDELSDAELDSIVGGTAGSGSAFVHSILTTIFVGPS
ncbi:MAG TPA: hypothetical protein VFA04_09675 [Bryobacteraceae bacterium]|nr:hypothetical protein [Bryobacteraceae bacterium]